MNLHNDVTVAREQLDREFPADKDFKPKVSWIKRHVTSLAFRNLAIVGVVAGIVIFACSLISSITAKDNKAFAALKLPTCSSPDWQVRFHDADKIEWTRKYIVDYGNGIHSNRHELTNLVIERTGAVEFNNIELLGDTDAGAQFFSCIVNAAFQRVLNGSTDD